MIPFRNLAVRVVTGTTDATPGNRSTHAHALGYAPTIGRVLIQAQATNTDSTGTTDGAQPISITAVDATNITVKSLGVSIAFTAFIFLDKNAPAHTA